MLHQHHNQNFCWADSLLFYCLPAFPSARGLGERCKLYLQMIFDLEHKILHLTTAADLVGFLVTGQ